MWPLFLAVNKKSEERLSNSVTISHSIRTNPVRSTIPITRALQTGGDAKCEADDTLTEFFLTDIPSLRGYENYEI